MNLDPLIWRYRILQSKSLGYLPTFPWSKVPGLFTRPSENWEHDYFLEAVSRDETSGAVLYQTPFGQFYGDARDHGSLGVVIMEEICRIYQRYKLVVEPGDVVVDLGAHLGTFTRLALSAGDPAGDRFRGQSL